MIRDVLELGTAVRRDAAQHHGRSIGGQVGAPSGVTGGALALDHHPALLGIKVGAP